MLLARFDWTAGDKRLRTVNYDDFLADGVTLVTAAVTCPDSSVTISGIDIATNPRKATFFVAGGTVNTTFTVTVQVTDSTGQIVTDTIDFSVGAP
jgi:hypothetical protein